MQVNGDKMPGNRQKNDRNTCCIILARGGSKGVHKKNLRKIGGVSLIGRSVRAGMRARLVEEVFVSTDDEEIAQEARNFGARTLLRPKELAGDHASSEDGWLDSLHQIEGISKSYKRLVFLQCTSPFTTGADIDLCLETMEKQGADCGLSVSESHAFIWCKNQNGFGTGVNHNEQRPRQRRQDIAPEFRENGAIYCVNTRAFKQAKHRFCGSVALCKTDAPPIEIDSLADLNLCRQMAKTIELADVPFDKLAQIKAVVMDFDGVHTDNLVLTDQNGVETVRTSRGDGLGLGQLGATGHWALMILSKERNPTVIRRGSKLGIEVQNGIDDKRAVLEMWLSTKTLLWKNLLYVGNDVNDLAAINAAGLSACPADSHPSVLAAVDWVLPYNGGHGALRFMCDTLLHYRVSQ